LGGAISEIEHLVYGHGLLACPQSFAPMTFVQSRARDAAVRRIAWAAEVPGLESA